MPVPCPYRAQVFPGLFLGGKPRLPGAPLRPGILQAAPRGGSALQLPPALLPAPGRGLPLPPAIQQRMESVFGVPFADVRVHVGPQAASVGALAFALGSDLYFAPGQYNPSSPQGQRLLGHELAHVVQQRTGRVRNPFGAGVAIVQDLGLEAEAERMGLRASQQPVAAPAVRTHLPPPPSRHPTPARAAQRMPAPSPPPPRHPRHPDAGLRKALQRCPEPGDCGCRKPGCGPAAGPPAPLRRRVIRVRSLQPRRLPAPARRVPAPVHGQPVALQRSRLPLPPAHRGLPGRGIIQRATVSGCTHANKTVLEIGDDMHQVIQQIFMADEHFAGAGPWTTEYEVVIQNGNQQGNANGYCDLLAHRDDGADDNPDLYILVGEIKPLSRTFQVIPGIEEPGVQRDRYKNALAQQHQGSTVGNLNWMPPLDAQMLGGDYAGQSLYIQTDYVSGIYYYHCTQAVKSSVFGKVKASVEEQTKIDKKESDEEQMGYNGFGQIETN
jgi:hypothetical protein